MDATEIRILIEEKYALLDAADAFTFLGISDESGEEDIKRAYFRLAKLVHPDRVARAGIEDMADEATAVFKTLTAAHNTLMDARSRAEVIRQRRSGVAPEGELKNGAEERRIFTHRGDLMLKRRSYSEAEGFFRRALELKDDDPEVLVRLGMSVFYNTVKPESKRREEARRLWEQAEKLADNPARAKYHLALYWKSKNDPGKMEKLLRDAVKKQPQFVEAARELRLLEMRKGRTKATPNFLSKLWAELTKKR